MTAPRPRVGLGAVRTLLWRAVLLVALWLAAVAPSVAQTPGGGILPSGHTIATGTVEAPLDFDAWEATAERVEQVLGVGIASDAALTELRTEVVEWRERFLANLDANSGRLASVRERLASLPPAPAPDSGLVEPEVIAAERSRLTAELETLEGPRLRAQLAFSHADSLVREIDTELRARQADNLSQRVPLPVNPLNWNEPLSEIVLGLRQVPLEIAAIFANQETRREVLTSLPSAVALLVLGLLLIVRSGYWTGRLLLAAMTIPRTALRLTVEGIGLLLQLALPLVGLLALMAGLGVSGVLGETGNALLASLAAAAVIAIVGLWLVARLYPRQGVETMPPDHPLTRKQIRRARRQSIALVITLALQGAIELTSDALELSAWASGYAKLPVALICAVALFRVGQIYRSAMAVPEPAEPDPDEPEPPSRPFVWQVIAFMAGLAQMVAIAGVTAAALGYINGAEAAIMSSAATFLLIGAVARGQLLVQRTISILRGRPADAEPGLLATLASWMLGFAAIPVAALMWGARPTDLSELWTQLREGVQLGDARIAPATVVSLIVVFAVGFLLTRFVQGMLSQTILPKTRLDIGAQRALTAGVGYVGITLAGLMSVTAAGLDLSSLAIVAGALSVGIGFGLQTIVSNFVSGIILLIERPVAEGDWIEVGGQMGFVRAISVRATRIETFDRTEVIVPNQDLIANQVTNWTRGNLMGRVIIPVGVAHDSDTRQVDRVLREIAEAHPMVTIRPAPLVLFMGIGDSALTFEIRAILRDVNFILDVRSDINHEIARRFAEEGIVIAFPQRDLWVRGQGDVAVQSRPSMAAMAQPPLRTAQAGGFLTAADVDPGGGDGR